MFKREEATESRRRQWWGGIDKEADKAKAIIPVIYVRLLQSVRLLPHQSETVLVHVEGKYFQEPLLFEYQPRVEASLRLQVEDAVNSPAENGIARMVLANLSGFTQVAGEGYELGETSEVTVVESNEGLADEHDYMLNSTNTHSQKRRDVDRRQKVQTMLEDSTLHDQVKAADTTARQS